MSEKKYDVVILTDERYLNPTIKSDYINNVLLEDDLIIQALKSKGLKVHRTNWDNSDFDWTTTKTALFRATWDYFDRIDEFLPWLESVKYKTKLINPYETIIWNIDKHYLQDLADKGVNIPSSKFIEAGNTLALKTVIDDLGYTNFILKPAISGGGRHTYKISYNEMEKFDSIFKELTSNEAMIIQDYQKNITTKGEVAHVFFGKDYSHSVLKLAQKGDFRVQDDFGGTIHYYSPSEEEINFATHVISLIKPVPAYARVDLIWDNNDKLCLSEIELIEPELWFRKKEGAADMLANEIINFIS